METKKIYIVLTSTRTILARIIRCWVKNPYNHVSISLDRELNEMYCFGRRRPRNPFIAGFIKEDWETGFHATFNNIPCLVYECEIDAKIYDNIKEIIDEFYMDHLKYKFNIIGLIGNAVGFDIHRERHYYCAEFLSYLFEESGLYSFNEAHTRRRPMDFSGFLNSKLIYDGYINDYKEQSEVKQIIL